MEESERARIDPPDYFMIMVVVSVVLHYFFPIKQVVDFPYRYVGILFIVFGVYFNLWVYFCYKRVGNPMETVRMPRVLIVSGLFRVSRNPLYLGMFFILIGEAVLLGSVVSFVLPLFFIVGTSVWVVPIEERNLERRFGKKYLVYKKRVGRWV